MIFKSVFLLISFVFLSFQVMAANIPEKFFGEWFLIDKNERVFPYHDYLKYPAKITISKSRFVFVDQYENSCVPEGVFYDDELDMLIFRHCFPPKSELTIPVFYRLGLRDGGIFGAVWQHKMMFRLEMTGDRE